MKTSPAQNFTPGQTGILQRKSALWNTPALVEDPERDKEKLTLQRSLVEPRFGHDFGNVRIHNGPQADWAAASVQARAFTLGRDVVFAAGQHDPGSEGGKRLLAHELTHVVQQSGSDEVYVGEKRGLYPIVPSFAKGYTNCQTWQSEQSRELSDSPLSRMGNSQALRLDLSSRRRIGEIIGDLAEPPQLHTDNEAVRATQDLGARGFAYGNHVAIDSSRYPPGSHNYERLLVHELTHVRQHQENNLGNSRETEAIAAERKMGGQINHRSAPAANSAISLTPDHIEAFHLDLETSEVEILLDDGSRITGHLVMPTNLRPGRYLVHWDSTRGGLQFDPWPTSEEVISFNISGTVAFRTRFASLRERISASSPVPFTVSEGETRAEEAPLTTETRPVSEQAEDDPLHGMEPSQDALEGIHLFPAIDPSALPSTDGVDLGTDFRVGVYRVFPQVRRLPDGSRTVPYCIAWNTRTERNEFLIGPGNINQFREHIDIYTNGAGLSYMMTPHGEQPPAYIAESWRAQTAFLAGDMEGYERHRDQAWAELAPDREAIFEGIISGLRSLQRQGIARLRAQANELPEPARSRALAEVRNVEAISEIFIRLMLTVVGIVAGAIDALINMVVGLFRLLVGIMEGILLFFYGFIDEGERFNQWADEVDEALSRLPAALRAAIDNWLTEFGRASEDRQTIMIGELTGQILAIIATFGATASRAGAATRIVARFEGAAPRFALAGGGELAPAGAVAVDVATPAAAATGVGIGTMAMVGEEGGGPRSTGEAIDELEELVEGRGSSARGRSTERGIYEENIATEAGTAMEAPEIAAWSQELSAGFEVISHIRFPEWLRRIFPGQGRPDMIAINHADELIIVGDVTSNPGSTVHRLYARQETILHIEKTIMYAERLAGRLPPELQGYRVVAQERYWELGGQLSRQIRVGSQ